MANVRVQALINLPQWGLTAGQSGDIEINDDDLRHKLALGHLAKVGDAAAPTPAPEPEENTLAVEDDDDGKSNRGRRGNSENV